MLNRFTRNGPNSTLQIDDNKNIVSTPDGKIDQSKNIFLVILCLLDFPEFQFNKSQFVLSVKVWELNVTVKFTNLNVKVKSLKVETF